MQIERYAAPLLGTNMYLLHEGGHAILIDTFWDEALAKEFAARYVFDYIIMTHEHYDHISGGNALRGALGCPILASAACAARMRDPTLNFSRYFDAYCELQRGERVPMHAKTADYTCEADECFEDEFTLSWQGNTLALTETPGHTPGGICILANGTALFSGDTLLPGGLPMTRFPGGNKADLEEKSMPYLRALPGNTLVYPGHGKAFVLESHPLFNGGNPG